MIKLYTLTGWLNFKRIFLHGDLSMIKIAIAMASLMWAFMLYAPGNTFSRPTYSVMLHTMSETSWATFFCAHGLIAVWAVLWQRTDRWLIICDSVLGSLLWTGSCYMMIIAYSVTGDPLPAATGANIVIAVFSWWCLVRNNYGRRT
jgi:hypothetical protein